METCTHSAERNYALLIAISALAMGFCKAKDQSETCPAEISIPRNSENKSSVGESLTLRCPVQFCPSQLPNVTWCKLTAEQCAPIIAKPGISFEWTEQEGNKSVYVLKFGSVNINDTGSYRCSAEGFGSRSVGHAIKVIVIEEGTSGSLGQITTSSTEPTMMTTPENSNTVCTSWIICMVPGISKNMLWVFYIIILIGVLCILIISISLLIYCIRRIKAKRRMSHGPETAEEVDFVLGNPDTYMDQSEMDILPYSPPTDLPNELDTLPCNKDLDDNEEQISHALPEEQDSVVYADLKHTTIDIRMRSLHHLEHNQTEYATVCLKN